MGYNIYHNFVINVPAKAVFDAVSLPDHLDNWWTLKSSGIPVLGAKYNLNFTDNYNWFCKISQLEINSSIFFKMTKSDTDWDSTTFGFDLEEKHGQTYVRFSHINWPKDNDHFKYSSFCWAMLLNGLKNYLEKGEIVPFQNRN
ncbi:SRPBCC family protein [Gaetbulibacter saemankumensis]|uniref:SRPBCC family protein n=1 Tax=Gaetbulibacter saemankumensis TaxID=311208 RepID=UPI00041AB2A2|nr:SRPBCC domain-containing protein [Gaetbulibacter saemankumensis]